MNSTTQIIKVIDEYIHRRPDKDVMRIYLTDHPGSLEKIAEETELSVSTVKRIINRCSFIYKYMEERR